jgi:PAS domain-containing protein
MAANEDLRRERAALEDFQNTLDLMLDGVFIFGPDDLKFTFVNRGAVQQMGYSREELLTLHPYDIKPEYPEPRFRQLVEPLREGRHRACVSRRCTAPVTARTFRSRSFCNTWHPRATRHASWRSATTSPSACGTGMP